MSTAVLKKNIMVLFFCPNCGIEGPIVLPPSWYWETKNKQQHCNTTVNVVNVLRYLADDKIDGPDYYMSDGEGPQSDGDEDNEPQSDGDEDNEHKAHFGKDCEFSERGKPKNRCLNVKNEGKLYAQQKTINP